MNWTVYLVPLLFLSLFCFALFRKVKLYDCFCEGVKGAIPLVVSLFPYLATVFILSELFTVSGLSDFLTKAIAPLFSWLGIPKELAPLAMMKPFSGSGSTALLSDILQNFGADSYVGRCAAVCYGSSETVFYISAVYFASIKEKKPALPLLIALSANFLAMIFGCLLCKFM